MQPQTINDIITQIDTIVQHCKQTKSRAGYFAALYKRMTIAVRDGIKNDAFEDSERMEKLDIIFASRYLDAYNAFTNNTVCSTSWKYAFDGCVNEQLTVIQQLVLGINTHINLDLAIAAATVAPGSAINGLEKDFNTINTVISSLFNDVQKCLEDVWMPMKLLRRVATAQQTDAVLNFSIGAARKASWASALLLANMNEEQKHLYIHQMDNTVYNLAQKIINPGGPAMFALKLVRRTEFSDVAHTINLIDTTVVN